MSTYIKRHSNKGRFLWAITLLAAFGGVGGYFYLYPESLPEWATKKNFYWAGSADHNRLQVAGRIGSLASQ